MNSGLARSRFQESSVRNQELLSLVSVPKAQKATCIALKGKNMKKQSNSTMNSSLITTGLTVKFLCVERSQETIKYFLCFMVAVYGILFSHQLEGSFKLVCSIYIDPEIVCVRSPGVPFFPN